MNLRLKSVCLLIAVLLLPVVVQAQGLADKVAEHTLANGAKVLLIERHTSPTVAAYISFKVGGVNETSEQRGTAHLLEHMLFKGTKTLGTRDYKAERKLLDRIEAVGSRIDVLKNTRDRDSEELAGLTKELKVLQEEHRGLVVKDEFSKIYAENGGVGYNAFTAKDQTTYLINLPSNKLELWAAIESDRLKNAVFREFYTERDVVQEERRRSYESNPGGMIYETLLATAFKVHPYRNPVIGWSSDIANLSLSNIRDFFHKYYRPVNMVITLVGDFQSDAALDLITRYFGSLESGVPVPPVVVREPSQTGERRSHIDFDAESQMMVAYHKPTMPNRDDYVFDLISQILSEGRTSRLYRSLVLDQQLVSTVAAYGAPGSLYDNLLVFSLRPQRPHSTAEAEEGLYKELDKLKTERISQAELNKARKQITTSMLRRLQSNNGLARMLSSFEVSGDWRYLLNYNEQLASITAEDIMDVAKRYFKADNRTVVTLGRGKQG